MRTLPTGIVTFLFTDVEGSTRLLNTLGQEADAVMAAHGRIIRTAVLKHGGVEVNTEGDSFFAAFPSPTSAVLAAADAQRGLAAEQQRWPQPVRVRMGLHTGEARLAGRDYIGLEVNRAARITAAAHGGQVLVSRATAALLADESLNGLRLRDLGEHRLKDLPTTERLYQLVIEGLPSEFPSPRSLDLTPSGLPQQLTPFFGRERELVETRRLLEQSRLLTLTGPGGSGKTRLAIELANDMRAGFPDGLFFVALASLREPDLVLSAIARQFGLSDGLDLRQRLLDQIAAQQALLILDNFEQLLAAAPVVADLLSATPRLKVLVTSRRRLGVYGERVYSVPPLTLPEADESRPLPELEREEAIALFLDRARAAAPDFVLSERSAPAVIEIVRRLDGLPLAIELAAARTRLLAPEAIVERLGDRLRLLGAAGNGSETGDRQRTLRGTIKWSYDLLDADEAALFTRLAVFLGGAPLWQIVEVLGADDELGVIEQLGSLIDQSLVRRAPVEDELRVELLETIREFALERLAARGELDEYRERHAVAYTRFAEDAAPKLVAEEGGRWLDRMERELANLRGAWGWALDGRRADIALRLAAATWRFWQMRGRLNEGRERAEQALELAGADTGTELLARGLEAAGSLAYWMADFASARRHYEHWLELERRSGARRGVADALYNLSFAYFVPRDDPLKARELAEEALAIYRETGDQAGQAQAVWALGGIVSSLPQPDLAAARTHFREAQRLFHLEGNHRMLAWAHFMYAGIEARDQQRASARTALHEALKLFVELRDVSGYALALRGLATLEWHDGRRETAARLAGASDRIEQTTGVNLSTATSGQWSDAPERAEVEADPRLAAAWAEGSRLEPETAVAEALALCSRGAGAPSAAPGG